MELYQKMFTYGALVAGLVGLSGCKCKFDEEKPPLHSHFAAVPMVFETGMALTSGDFDGDGDLDFIVGAKKLNINEGRLYFFVNDGEGNFTLKKPTTLAEKPY